MVVESASPLGKWPGARTPVPVLSEKAMTTTRLSGKGVSHTSNSGNGKSEVIA